MLATYLNEVQNPRPELVVGHEAAVETFEWNLSNLGGPDSFPNPRINILAQAAWTSVGKQDIIFLTADPGYTDTTTFTAYNLNGNARPGIIVPLDYHLKAQTAPVSSLGSLAFTTELCRSFGAGILFDTGDETVNANNSKVANIRSAAVQAEVLHTIVKMAVEEEVDVQLDSWEQQIMQDYPNGLESLPGDATYEQLGAVKPVELTKEQIKYLALIESSANSMGASTFGLTVEVHNAIATGLFGSYLEIERALRSIDSKVFVLAIHPSKANFTTAVHPRTKQEVLFGAIAVTTDAYLYKAATPGAILSTMHTPYTTNIQMLNMAGDLSDTLPTA